MKKINVKISPYFSPVFPKQYIDDTVLDYCPPLSRVKKDIDVGLTIEEINKIYPSLVGVSPTHDTFIERVKDFNRNLSFTIPASGTLIDVTVGNDGMPDNIHQYLLYKIAMLDETVAKTEEDIKFVDGKVFRYKLVDIEKAKEQENAEQNEISKAIIYYAKLIQASKDERGVAAIRQLLVVARNNFTPNLSIDEIANYDITDLLKKLKVLFDSNPSLLLKLEKATDSIQRIAFVELLISYGVVSVEGDSIFYNGEVIAKTKASLKDVIGASPELYAKLQAQLRAVSAASKTILEVKESAVSEQKVAE